MLDYGCGITLQEYCELREAVGWFALTKEQAQAGLDHTDHIASCRDNGNIVGSARIFWDKGYIALLCDVMVKPEYQGHGVGKRLVADCIRYVFDQLQNDMRIKIIVMSAKGKEKFYEKLGFQSHPNDNDGAGMQLWLQR